MAVHCRCTDFNQAGCDSAAVVGPARGCEDALPVNCAAKHRVRQASYLAVCLLLAVGLAEGTARVAKFKTGYFEVPTRANCLQRSRILGMEFAPNCKGHVSYTDFQTNEVGLRDYEIRDDGSVRILALGDSCTWGWAVAQSETYPSVLQALLNGRPGSTTYRVINAGLPGYSSYQGLVYLREFGLSFNPAIVIIGFGFNDAYRFGSNDAHRPGDIEREIEWQRRWLAVLEVDDFFMSYSRFWRWLRWQTAPANPHLNLQLVGSPEKYKENMKRIIELVRERGGKPLLLSFWDPLVIETLPYQDVISDLGARLAVPIVVYSGPRMDIVHPTKEGYIGLATHLARVIEVEGLL
jgi:lysophospholipase L1-like esterase